MIPKTQEQILKFFNKAIKQNQIYEKTSIKHFENGKRIQNKNITYIKKETQEIITEFKLENKTLDSRSPNTKNFNPRKILLIKDYPLNQYLSYSIILNKNTPLFQFKLNQKTQETSNNYYEYNKENQIYIANQEIIEILKSQIKKDTIKQINTKDLINQTFTQNYKSPELIQKIREYISKTKKINPQKIIETNLPNIQNFTPTLKNTHFKLAKKLELPIIPQIKNEYIESENINIFDIKKLIEIISPLKTIQTKQNIPIEKKTLKKTYLDISTTYHLKFNTKKLIEKIQNTQITSEPKNKIIKTIKNLTQTEISQNFGETKIPIWKVHKNQDFIQIKNFSEFQEITGIKYPENQKFLNEIYIQDRTGEKGELKNQYLKKRYEKTLETLPEDNILIYKKPLDLAIKAISCDKINLLIKYQKTSPKQIEKLKTYIENLIETTILKTIEYNKIPQNPNPKTESTQEIKDQKSLTQTQKYFQSLAFKLNNEFNKFLKTPKKTNLIHKTNNELKTLSKYISKTQIKYKELYYICQIIIQTLKIIDIFNLEYHNELLTRFTQYFKTENYPLPKNKNKNLKNISNEYRFIKQIFLANKLIKKSKTKNKIIIFQKQKFNTKLLNQTIPLEQIEPKFKLKLNPNYPQLIKTFPFKYSDLGNQIKKLELGIENPTLDLKISKIPLKKEYCKITKIYENYKTICENPYFTILKNNN